MIYLELFITFLKIGAFTFGGGYAMIPLIQGEVVSHGWLTTEALIDFLAVSESTPGPFAVNISTYVGTVVAGVPGALVSTLGVTLPSFIIIIVIARFFMMFQENRFIQGAFLGLKPAVIGLIGSATFSIIKSLFFEKEFSATLFLDNSISILITVVLTFLALKKIHPIMIILISGCLGIICSFI